MAIDVFWNRLRQKAVKPETFSAGVGLSNAISDSNNENDTPDSEVGDIDSPDDHALELVQPEKNPKAVQTILDGLTQGGFSNMKFIRICELPYHLGILQSFWSHGEKQ